MVNKHGGKYICGYCKKETELDDEALISRIDGINPPNEFKSPCSCGHFSYASTIRFKASVNAKNWRFGVGSCE